ncbi:hypothetical protein WK78_28990 [Burkholderia cepacia]|uniref:hypothetical protein n=1 Tax=Burkholderia cepacia TaxID=292 RepID=UPI00075A103E|nr:hypothetical protein [Burkholderia cepacia]KVV20324.1 hypothetical protein WK78_28990 [Burkholderia cepacia]
MSTTHTPGPWYVFDNGVYLEIRTQLGSYAGEQIGDVCASKHIDGVEDNPVAAPNARLMAAAPELFEALLDAKDWITASNSPHGLRERIGAALAKARSEV